VKTRSLERLGSNYGGICLKAILCGSLLVSHADGCLLSWSCSWKGVNDGILLGLAVKILLDKTIVWNDKQQKEIQVLWLAFSG
jgi:hypothetical protein